MTRGGGSPRRRISGGWALPIGVLAGVGAATLAGILSRSVLADLVAWWPAWLGLGALAWFSRDRRIGPLRVAGLVALVALGFTLLFLWGHLRGWPLMPSAASQLVGPEASGYEGAALSARVPGMLEVGPATTGFLYTVEQLRWGGQVGPADAEERIQGSTIGVNLVEVADPGLYEFSGWSLLLAPGIPWSLSLEGAVDADLAALTVRELQLDGVGSVSLGIGSSASVTLGGEWKISVPSAAPVRVIGEATVPDGWTATAEGWASPASGEGWVFSVAPGAELVITTH